MSNRTEYRLPRNIGFSIKLENGFTLHCIDNAPPTVDELSETLGALEAVDGIPLDAVLKIKRPLLAAAKRYQNEEPLIEVQVRNKDKHILQETQFTIAGTFVKSTDSSGILLERYSGFERLLHAIAQQSSPHHSPIRLTLENGVKAELEGTVSATQDGESLSLSTIRFSTPNGTPIAGVALKAGDEAVENIGADGLVVCDSSRLAKILYAATQLIVKQEPGRTAPRGR